MKILLHIIVCLSFVVFAERAISEGVDEWNASSGVTLADHIEDFIDRKPQMADAAIEVTIKNGVATLQGEVKSMDQREWAVAATYAFNDIKGVIHHIEVHDESFDNNIASVELLQILKSHPALKGASLHAKIDEDGNATITGQAGTRSELELATEFASRIHGVKKINQHAALNYCLSRPDSAISAHVMEKIGDDPLLAHLPVSVSVNKGRLLVTATVPDRKIGEHLMSKCIVQGIRGIELPEITYDDKFALGLLSQKEFNQTDSFGSLQHDQIAKKETPEDTAITQIDHLDPAVTTDVSRGISNHTDLLYASDR